MSGLTPRDFFHSHQKRKLGCRQTLTLTRRGEATPPAPSFLPSGRSPEVHTARVSLEACLRPCGPPGHLSPPWPASCLASNSPTKGLSQHPLPYQGSFHPGQWLRIETRRALKRMVGKVFFPNLAYPGAVYAPSQHPHSCIMHGCLL